MSGPGSYTLLARVAVGMSLCLLQPGLPPGLRAGGALAAPASGPPATAEETAAVFYDEAVREAAATLSRGTPATALTLLDRALRVRPEGIEALLLLGRCFVAMDRYEDAVRAFDRAAAIAGPDQDRGLDALYGRADALARMERNVEAVEALQGILARAPNHPAVHHDLGRIHLVLGRYDEAMREFRLEIDRHGSPDVPPEPGTPVASSWEGLGIAAYRSGDDATALEAFAHVVIPAAPGPATIDAMYHHGLALARRGRNDEAAVQLDRVLAVSPDHRGALQNLARVEGARGRDEERQRALARFEDLYRLDVEANTLRLKVRDLRKRAESAALAGDTAAATSSLREAASLAGDDPDVLMDLGRWLYRAGNRDASEKALQDALARDPLRADAHDLIGRIRMDRGDAAAGIASFERATQLSPMSIEYHVHLAQTYLRVGRSDEGVSELRLAQRLDPADPRSYFNLGIALAQAGALREAAGQLDEAVRLGFEDPRVHQVLARIHQALGDTERSLAEQRRYEQLVSEADRRAPKDPPAPEKSPR